MANRCKSVKKLEDDEVKRGGLKGGEKAWRYVYVVMGCLLKHVSVLRIITCGGQMAQHQATASSVYFAFFLHTKHKK